jgi:hypothetical protein
MIRKLLISLLLLVVLAVGATFLYLDRIVTTGIEVVGSQVLGTKVTVASVTISPLNGIGSIPAWKSETLKASIRIAFFNLSR